MKADQESKLEELCRYVLRPPLANGRLRWLEAVTQLLTLDLGGDAKHAMKFDSFEESERAERAYYRSSSPQDRLDILLELVARHEDARGEASLGLARVCCLPCDPSPSAIAPARAPPQAELDLYAG